ncbi:NmrA family NAD(P)-binding protein [Ornithinimicrobium sp. LYQ103]|uniref:NmrA family NAD(P)-binding protein n=1 Tax=Ornithinimicrobium sp. LYQ103 TaxID=3378796 RepID=UPI0038529A92
MQPVLVTGASGNVGAHLVRLLLEAGDEVRAAATSPSGDDRANPAGLTTVRFDFTDPATWDDAFTGVHRMFLLRPPHLGRPKRDLIPALRRAEALGVQHVVFLSLQGAERNRLVPHAAVEQWLRASSLSWSFVRASFFMQNLTGTHGADLRERSQIVVPAGRGATAFVDAADVAAVAAACLLDPDAHAQRAWTPTGPAALTYDEVAAVLSEELDRPVHYARPGLLRYALHARRALRMPLGMVAVTSAIYTSARLGLAAGLTADVQEVTGRPPVTFLEFVLRERDDGSLSPAASATRGP